MAEKKNKGGRPSKFDSIDLKQVEFLATRGFVDQDMAEFFKVTITTWHNWKKAHTEFFDSLKDWKTKADARVERALYERATGYSHPENKIFSPTGKENDVVTVETTKHYPPDPTSCIFWLKNRDKENWRDKQDGDSTPESLERELAAVRQAILNSAVNETGTG